VAVAVGSRGCWRRSRTPTASTAWGPERGEPDSSSVLWRAAGCWWQRSPVLRAPQLSLGAGSCGAVVCAVSATQERGARGRGQHDAAVWLNSAPVHHPLHHHTHTHTHTLLAPL
jgi:hypothetical protein